ncbi:polyhydroxyalkanoate synthesis regulator DNA-binding domain-containing protein [Desulfobacterales bacterium HSG16]|nr:polyhydroxyalkanoate synthesis regulator DNA-binding domain-containing protein [Desulfobacterales bacterium HSG16]
MIDKVVLKKYPNRRLYDTQQSKYITLRDVADIIRAGKRVEVIDLKTDQDVTALILSQIIMEKAKKDSSLLPVSLLHLIIRFGEDILSDFFEKYMENVILSYLKYKKSMDKQLNICLELGMDFSSMAGKTIQDMAPFSPFLARPFEKGEKNEDNS